MKYLVILFFLHFVIIGCTSENEVTSENTSAKTEDSEQEVSSEPEHIEFPSGDGLMISANLYDRGNEYPVIVLCHQAGFNKFEYTEIAKTLFDKGYNCLAIDQRSGGPLIESFNETYDRAVKKGKAVDYVDAEPDIRAAIDFAAKKYKRKVILWGSSYSSTLALHIAPGNKNVEAVIAFSPGDYLDPELGSLKDKLMNLKVPMFATSSKEEAAELTTLLDGLTLGENQEQFIPKSVGEHGSRALWKTDANNKEYWDAVLDFLKRASTKR